MGEGLRSAGERSKQKDSRGLHPLLQLHLALEVSEDFLISGPLPPPSSSRSEDTTVSPHHALPAHHIRPKGIPGLVPSILNPSPKPGTITHLLVLVELCSQTAKNSLEMNRGLMIVANIYPVRVSNILLSLLCALFYLMLTATWGK